MRRIVTCRIMLHSLIIPKGYGILFPFKAARVFKNFELPTEGVYKFKPFLFVPWLIFL